MAEFEFGKVAVGIEPDATGFRTKAKAALTAETEGLEVKVQVVADTAGLAAAIRRQVKEVVKANNLEIQVPVRLNIDKSQLKTDLRVVQEQVKAQNITVNLGVAVTKTEITAELRKIREQVKADGGIEVLLKPTFDRSDIRRAVTEMSTVLKAEGLEVPIRPVLNPDRARFIAEVKAFIDGVKLSIPDLTVNIRANTSRTGGRGGSATSEISELDDKLKTVGRTAGALVGPLGGAGAQFARLTQTGSLAAAAIGGLGVAFAGIIGYGVKIAADAQLADKGITALTKSIGFNADQSKAFIKQLEQFASVTPFEVPQVKEATKLLLGAGTAAEDILPTLQRITDVGSVLGAQTENIENVAKALAKVRGKGTAQLLELNQIRRNLPGFDPVKAIADFKGQSLADTYTQISKKAIPAELAIAAINKGLTEFPGAAGAAAAAAETLSGRFSTLKDNVALGFKDAFLQPAVEKPLNDLLKNLAENAKSQIGEAAKSLAPIITAFGPALQGGIQLFLELTKASAPFFVKLLEGATILEAKLIPAVQDLKGPASAFGELIKAIVPALGTLISLISSGVSPFGLMSTALKAIAPLLTLVSDLIDGLPEPLRVVLGLMILLNRQKLFTSFTEAGPKAIEIIKTIGKVAAGLAESGIEKLIVKLDAYAAASTAAGTASVEAFAATSAAATAASASTSTALANLASSQFQTARIRGQGAIGSGSGLDIIDVASIEKVREIGPGAAAAIEDVGSAAAKSTAKTGLFTTGLQKLAGGASGAVKGVKGVFSALTSPGGLTAVVLSLAAVAAIYEQIQKSAEAARKAGEEFSSAIADQLNDASKKKFSLADVYLGQLSDPNSEVGKIFKNDAFSAALKSRGERIADYAEKLSKDSKSAAKSYFDLAQTAQSNRSLAERGFDFLTGNDPNRKGLKLTASDTEDGLKRLQAAQKAGVDLLQNASGKGSDIVKKTLQDTQKSLIEQGKFQYKATVDSAGNLDLVKTKQADYNLTVQATNQKLKDQGISVDGVTGKITLYDQALVALANATGLSLDATDEFKKQIDTLADSIDKAYSTIRGTDTISGPNGLASQLGGASEQVLTLINNGGDLTSGLAALTSEMGLTGDAAADFLTKATAFGTAAVAEIAATQEAFKGLVPTASSVFDELKAKAGDVLPTYDELLTGLQKKLTESAAVNDNLGKIISRGGSGIIETLKQLPADAQAAYAAAIAGADDKTFVTLEAKSRELSQEGISQIQNQGLLSIATVQASVDASLQGTAVAQAALEKKALEIKTKLRVDANLKPNKPGQRKLLLEDANSTTAATVGAADSVPSAVSAVTDAVNASLATVPAAAKKAADDATANLVPLAPGITAATVPGLQTWSGDVSNLTDDAGNSFNGLAIRAVDAFDTMAAGLDAPAQRVLTIVRSIADAINSVSGQVGSSTIIKVPGIPGVVRRPNVDTKLGVHHDGNIIGAPTTTRSLNGPLASNEALVIAQKGEGVIPVDAMKRLGLSQYKFIRDGDIEGLIQAQQRVPGAKKSVDDARSLSPGVLGGMGPALAGAVDGALGQLTKNVDKYLDEVGTLITAKLGMTPGLIPGGSITGSGSAAAAGWIRAAMALTGAPESWFVGLMTLAKRESGFNPRSINLWDSNAKAGHPSIGLMQTIGPTFKAYALPGHTDIYNPIDNAIASIRYIRARYGDISRVQQANPSKPPKGYEFGDLVTTEQMARIAERNRPELIVPLTNPARAEELLAKYLFDPTVSNLDPNKVLDRLEAATGRRANAAPTSAGVVIADGGALVKIDHHGESFESMEATLVERVGPILRRVLS